MQDLLDIQPTTIRSESELDAQAEKRRFKFVIAEDEEDARNILAIALDASNWDITFCENGDEAVNLIKSDLPDIVISDIQMPGYNGMEVCRITKDLSNNIFLPVILLTSRSELNDKVNGLNCGADDYITKPFDIPELEARVRALLRTKILTDQLRETQNLLREKEKELVTMQIAGGAAHELGQPLTSLLLNCQMIGKISPESSEFGLALQDIQNQCARMRDILSKLNQLKSIKTTSYPGNLKIAEIGNS